MLKGTAQGPVVSLTGSALEDHTAALRLETVKFTIIRALAFLFAGNELHVDIFSYISSSRVWAWFVIGRVAKFAPSFTLSNVLRYHTFLNFVSTDNLNLLVVIVIFIFCYNFQSIFNNFRWRRQRSLIDLYLISP